MTHDRGRLTPVDVVFVGVALAALAGLAPALYDALGQQSGNLGQGTELLMQMLAPALVVTLLVVVYRTSLLGGGS